MRKILISSALILSLAGGSAAFAADKPAAKPTATAASTAKPAKAAKMAARDPKGAECAKQWKAEKKHTQTRKAFMETCAKA